MQRYTRGQGQEKGWGEESRGGMQLCFNLKSLLKKETSSQKVKDFSGHQTIIPPTPSEILATPAYVQKVPCWGLSRWDG